MHSNLPKIHRNADQGGAPASPTAAPASQPVETSLESIEAAILASEEEVNSATVFSEQSATAGNHSPVTTHQSHPGNPEDSEITGNDLASLRAELAELRQALLAQRNTQLSPTPQNPQTPNPRTPKPPQNPSSAEAIREGETEATSPQPSSPARATTANPLAGLTSHDALDDAEARSEAIVDWCLANFDGGVVKTANDEERELSAKDIRTMFAEHQTNLRRHIPAQRRQVDWLAQRAQQAAQFEADATSAYEWMKNAQSPERQAYDKLRNAGTALASHPAFALILAHAVPAIIAGMENRKGQMAKPASAEAPREGEAGPSSISHLPSAIPPKAATPTIAAPPLTGSAGGPRKPGSHRTGDAINAVVRAGGSLSSIEHFLAQIPPA